MIARTFQKRPTIALSKTHSQHLAIRSSTESYLQVFKLLHQPPTADRPVDRRNHLLALPGGFLAGKSGTSSGLSSRGHGVPTSQQSASRRPCSWNPSFAGTLTVLRRGPEDTAEHRRQFVFRVGTHVRSGCWAPCAMAGDKIPEMQKKTLVS